MSPSMTKVGIIYGAKSGQVRGHVYSETNDHFYWSYPLQKNEAMCFVPLVFHYAGHKAFEWAIRQAVQAHGNIRAIMRIDEPGARVFVRTDATGHQSVVMADPEIPGDAAVIARDGWFECNFGDLGDYGYEYKLVA